MVISPVIKDKLAFRRQLLSWYRKQNRQLPWRRLWRQHQNPYHVWLSEIMLQQTIIKVVIPAYERFLERFPDIKSLAAASEDEVRLACRGLGYYRRFGMLHQAAQQLVSQNRGKIVWPKDYEGWRALPGIGDYTASAIASITANAPTAVVDGNVERVFCRLGDIRKPANEPSLKKMFKVAAQDLLEVIAPGDFNQAIMELGQLVCTKSQPGCGICPVNQHCLAMERQSQHLAPMAKVKKAYIDVELMLYIAISGDKVGLYERPEAAKFLKGTMGFLTTLPEGEAQWRQDGGSLVLQNAPREHGFLRHSITHHRLRVNVRSGGTTARKPSRWVPRAALPDLLLSNLDKKAWELFCRRSRRAAPPLEAHFN